MAIEYGICPCSGSFEQRWVEVRMTVREEVLILGGVPQGACPLCGSRVYKAHTLEAVEAAMAGNRTDCGAGVSSETAVGQ